VEKAFTARALPVTTYELIMCDEQASSYHLLIKTFWLYPVTFPEDLRTGFKAHVVEEPQQSVRLTKLQQRIHCWWELYGFSSMSEVATQKWGSTSVMQMVINRSDSLIYLSKSLPCGFAQASKLDDGEGNILITDLENSKTAYNRILNWFSSTPGPKIYLPVSSF
jgi:hypothetical protein